jgi:hypothetical protein
MMPLSKSYEVSRRLSLIILDTWQTLSLKSLTPGTLRKERNICYAMLKINRIVLRRPGPMGGVERNKPRNQS